MIYVMSNTLPHSSSGQPHPEESAARNYYNAKADTFDAVAAESDWPFNNLLGEELRSSSEGGFTPRSVLDLGAGTGITTEVILNNTKPERVVAVDISSRMLDQLRRKLGHWPSLDIVERPIREYLAGTHLRFDLITALGVMNYLPDQAKTIRQAARVLRPLGRLMFTSVCLIPGHPNVGQPNVTFEGGLMSQRKPLGEILGYVSGGGLRVVGRRTATSQSKTGNQIMSALITAEKS